MSFDDAETDRIIRELQRRSVHVRQYLGRRTFELWSDGRFHTCCSTPEQVEAAIRQLLGITNDQGLQLPRPGTRRMETPS